MLIPTNNKVESRSYQWLVCTQLRLRTSRGIPTWKQYLFTGTEEECISFFLMLEFDDDEDMKAWLGDFASREQRDNIVRERYRDFGDHDWPVGFTRGRVTSLWCEGGIMHGMDNYVPALT